MALEAATEIQELVDTNPEGIDQLADADNHIRMIKTCVQTSLPGMTAPLTFTDPIKAGDPVDDTDLVTKQFLEGSYNPWIVGKPELWLLDALPVATGMTFIDMHGQAISRTTYADLFALYGVTYGAGDGSTTFNIPDARGQFLRIWDNAAGVDPDSATRTDRGDGTSGDFVGTKQADDYENHNHDNGLNSQLVSAANNGGNISGGFSGGRSNATISASGGDETRPKNIYSRLIMRIL